MLSLFAPYTAEEMWEQLGHEPTVALAGWPDGRPGAAGRGLGDVRRAGRRQGARPARGAARHRRGRAAGAGAGRSESVQGAGRAGSRGPSSCARPSWSTSSRPDRGRSLSPCLDRSRSSRTRRPTCRADRVERHAIAVVPLQVVIGGTAYDEGDVEAAAIVHALRAGQTVTTSRPNPQAFADVYAAAAAAGATAVVSVHLSAEMSGTVDSARLAAARGDLPGPRRRLAGHRHGAGLRGPRRRARR